ncbi:DUF6053 domain-containing protein [Lysobacter enzymogenes]|uniref:DUF6053 domain-containing protein n=1 Tax=Lysobacter enzymogenes TaxID=69 RepID=UPI003CCE0E56
MKVAARIALRWRRRCEALQPDVRAGVVGGTSVPTLSAQIAANRAESVGTEVPPTSGRRASGLKSLPHRGGECRG